MATYDRVTPATLSNFTAVIDDPTDSEDQNKIAQIDLQTRRFVYDFLITKFDLTTGMLLPAAVDDTSIEGAIAGSTSNAGTERGIEQGTVSTPDLRDLAVSTAKINTDAVTTSKIADGQVTTVKIADTAVTTAKLLDANVTEGKLANDAVTADKLKDDATGSAGAVTTDHVRTAAITTPKIADNAVEPDKLFLASAPGQILVADSANTFQAVAMSGAATIDEDGIVSLTNTGVAVIAEAAANGVNAGATLAGAAAFGNYNTRGVTVPWVLRFETVTGTVTLLASGKVQLAAGSYLVEGQAPGYACGKHNLRVSRYNSSNLLQESLYGSSVRAPATVTSESKLYAYVTVVSSDYLIFEHWSESVDANGMGVANSAGGAEEVYAQFKISKLA